MLTRETILGMGAGRELDALVAEKVMGWLVIVPDNEEDWYDRQVTRFPCLIQHREGGQWLTRNPNIGTKGHDEYWFPSAEIAAAWQLWPKIIERKWSMWIGDDGKGGWAAQVKPLSCNLHDFVRAETAPLAIVRAALLSTLEAP